ncbi:DUF1822 family protein [Kamptonema sp. UHCC 0994]|uniref:DUF1822 family protein n=1 Tax=Kamptonema sp. UHCC 0994 TaxID=3031329 RepID=UPI0023B8D305|nr:DUF1822 family protein [Kamptonema sp. UHCC 0994]MDF0552533.1 DUF1822 family protein [Kamptonema sp. UHCC 0994]
MTNYLTNSELDFESLSIEAIAIAPVSINKAIQISRQIKNPERQWQTYLTVLALFAFRQWAEERAPEFYINQEKCSILHPEYANIIEAACNLKLGDFKICLLAIGSFTDEKISIPRAAIDLPEFTAHFYVVVEIAEELEEARIIGFIRYDQLIEQFSSVNLLAENDWTYRLPWAWFNSNSDDLLLYLRYLQPDAIALPATPVRPINPLLIMQAQLSPVLPQLQSGNREIWELLTWEKITEIMVSPPLLTWLYQESIRPNQESKLTQGILNVWLWLQDEIDDLARELSWVLLPAFNSEKLGLAGATAMRSPIEELEAIVTQLERRGTAISPAARGACKTLNLASIPLRLYALSWPMLSTENIPEWKLLLILGGSPSGTPLPEGTKMQVSDNMSVLVEQAIDQYTTEPYLYSLVAGTWDEQFTVTLTLSNGAILTLPPFAFRPH